MAPVSAEGEDRRQTFPSPRAALLRSAPEQLLPCRHPSAHLRQGCCTRRGRGDDLNPRLPEDGSRPTAGLAVGLHHLVLYSLLQVTLLRQEGWTR